MAAPLKTQTEVLEALDGHSAMLYMKTTMASNAHEYLLNYNFELTGSMPGHTWTCPEGQNFEFNPSYGSLYFDSSDYGSLNPTRRRIFFRWLNHFIRECLNNYNETYGL